MPSSRRSYIIDAWPVLEWYRLRQPSSQRFEDFLQRAAAEGSTLLMSRMNFGEIRYKAMDYLSADKVPQLLEELARYVELVSIDDTLIDEAALLKFKYRGSYADCFAAALAVRHHAPVVTGDPDFLGLQAAGVLTVEWLGE